MKIFIGMTEIASQIDAFDNGFKSLGIDTLTAIYDHFTVMVDGRYDFVINEILPAKLVKSKKIFARGKRIFLRKLYKQLIWQKALDECDVFLFMWSSFKPDFSDFAALKKKGKRIIIFPVGSEVRWKPAADQDYRNYNLPIVEYPNQDYFRPDNRLELKLRFLRKAEKYADILFGAPNGFQLALRPYNQVFVPINLSIFKENSFQRKYKPVVIHAPSETDAKGTKFILPVLERLKNEGIDFEHKIIKKMPFKDIKKIYTDSDILVGQLLIPGAGKQEREALASGMVVLSSVLRQYPERIPPDCPIIDVGPDTLYQELKRVILDHPLRVQLAKKGRPYVEKYHNSRTICSNIISLLSANEPAYDFFPRFFRDQFIPESKKSLKTYNKWSKYVSETEWYKQYVKQGQRAGLVF